MSTEKRSNRRFVNANSSSNDDDNKTDKSKSWQSVWKNPFASKKEKEESSSNDDDQNNEKKPSRRRTPWRDVRKPSSSSSTANDDKKSGNKTKQKKDDDKKKAKKEQKSDKEGLAKPEEEKRGRGQRLSSYEKKKLAREQKRKKQEREKGDSNKEKEDGKEDAEKSDDNEDKDKVESIEEHKKNNETEAVEIDSNSTKAEAGNNTTTNAEGKKTTYQLVLGPPQQGGGGGGPYSQYPRGGPQRQMIRPGSQQPQPGMPSNQAIAITAVASLSGIVIKLLAIAWITKRLAADHEILAPQQHFVWECLNDRYTRDTAIFARVIAKPTDGISKLKWNKYLKSRRGKSNGKNVRGNSKNKDIDKGTLKKSNVPTKTVIVTDITPYDQLDIGYLTDVVTFLIGAQRKNLLGEDPEIILLLRSPGGEVTRFGLAAAQVARLQQMTGGTTVTVCVDSIAASGGYMIASQSSQIIAAPFAYVGSIGVYTEGLNFNKLLTDAGVKPLVIKAGEMKNTLSALGHVSDKEIQKETERMEEVHEAFIEWCMSRRPTLDRSKCNGMVLMGAEATKVGMVDRVMTSEEYIWEKICDGDHVLKLHRSYRDTDKTRLFARALDLLPHLKHQFTQLRRQIPMGALVQGYAILTVIHRAITKHFNK